MVRIRIDTGAGIPAYNREAVEHLLNDGNPYLNEAVQIVTLNVEVCLRVCKPWFPDRGRKRQEDPRNSAEKATFFEGAQTVKCKP